MGFAAKVPKACLSQAPVICPVLTLTSYHPTTSPGTTSSPKSQSIPVYNILWAELSQDRRILNIDYAQEVNKTQLRAATLSFPVAPDPAAAAAAASATDDDDNLYPPPDIILKWTDALMDRAYGPAQRRKRAYVLVNPRAGPGGAEKKWDVEVEPIFKAARMALTVHTTTFSGEAVDLAANMDIDQFDIVVPCSGDGLPHEVFNGLGKRPDARRALQKVAVAHVPCGSGNALACNVFGTHRAGPAALAIVKGVPTPLDLVSITQGDTRFLSFLSQALGLMAEADLGTEHLRWMGEHRFTYGVVTRILKKKTYPCDLFVKMEVGDKDGVRELYRRHHNREENLVGGGGRGELDKLTPAESDNTDVVSQNDEGLPPLKYGTIQDKLPEGWEKIDAEKLGNFYCGNVSSPKNARTHTRLFQRVHLANLIPPDQKMAYMAPDVIFFNAACFNDGCLDLVTVDGDVPAAQVPALLLSVGNNSFLDQPLVHYYKVSAFRVAPKYTRDPYISIDGEKVPFAPFQAEVHRGLGTVLTKRGVMEAPGPRGWDKALTL